MKTLFQFELKKIFKRKSTKIAIVLTFSCIILLTISFVNDNLYTNINGDDLHGPSAIHLKKEQFSNLEGYLTIEALSNAFLEYQSAINNSANDTSEHNLGSEMSNEVYIKHIQKYNDVLNLIRRTYSPVGTYNYYVLSSLSLEDLNHFYSTRSDKVLEVLNMDYSYGNYIESEKVHIIALNNKVKTPFYFAYTDGWSDMLKRGFLTISLIIVFAVCVCISPLFSNEYQSGTDAIILSTKYGKNMVIIAKIISSVVFASILYFGAMILFSGIMLFNYGMEGWNASFQILSFLSPYPLTILQVFLNGIALGYLVVLSTTSFTIFLSAKSRTAFSVIIVNALWILAPLFIQSSKTNMLFNRILELFPAKAMDAFTVFSVFDTYNLFGHIVSYPCMIIVFSIVVIIISIPFTYTAFKNHQVI